jgi:hypothetical protein
MQLLAKPLNVSHSLSQSSNPHLMKLRTYNAILQEFSM